MMAEKDETDILLDAIRKELSAIVEEGEKRKPKDSTKTVTSNLRDMKQKEETPRLTAGAEEQPLITTAVNLENSELPLDDPFVVSLQQDVKKMQMELDKSYELFRTIGEKFENIDFSSLGTRIKDLRLHEKTTNLGAGDTVNVAADLHKMLDQSFRDNRLETLTLQMGEKFRQHPGEFGDIPEVSSFFQACTQLEHGLAQLKRQRDDTQLLGDRLLTAAESSYKRIDEIHNLLSKDKNKNSTK